MTVSGAVSVFIVGRRTRPTEHTFPLGQTHPIPCRSCRERTPAFLRIAEAF